MAGPTINELTNNLDKLSNEPRELCYSHELVTRSNVEIHKFLSTLDGENGVKDDLMGLDTYGDVGEFPSALATKENLVDDVRGIQDLLDHHIAYLGSLKHAIETVGNYIESVDEAGSQ